MAGTLYLVATPIGNLGDITARALETLRAVRFIACEDTRHSRVLLDHFGIGGKDLVSLPAFAEGQRAGRILDRIAEGEDCALVTDAGSPAISDPGERLVAEALERGLTVVPVPGATALVAALSASGLPTGRFHFLGFLPRKGPERRAMLEEVAVLSATLVLYESPRRLGETLPDLQEVWGDRRACVARELTKLHEEVRRGTPAELAQWASATPPRGEMVIVVGPPVAEAATDAVIAARLAPLLEDLSLSEAARRIAQELGVTKARVYELGLALKHQDPG